MAVGTTISTAATRGYADAHPGAGALGGAALTHGYQIAYYVFAGVAVFAAVICALMITPARALQPTIGREIAEAEGT